MTKENLQNNVFVGIDKCVVAEVRDRYAISNTIHDDLYWKLDLSLFSILSVILQNNLHSEILIDLKTELRCD